MKKPHDDACDGTAIIQQVFQALPGVKLCSAHGHSWPSPDRVVTSSVLALDAQYKAPLAHPCTSMK